MISTKLNKNYNIYGSDLKLCIYIIVEFLLSEKLQNTIIINIIIYIIGLG